METQCVDQRLDDLSVGFATARAAAEVEVCMVVLNDPAPGVEAGGEVGLTPDLFDVRRDLRIIYCACVVAGRDGRDAVLSLARRGLRAEWEWEPWTDARLGAFAEYFSPFPAPGIQAITLRLLVPRLVAIHQRQREAGEYIKQAARLLEGRAA